MLLQSCTGLERMGNTAGILVELEARLPWKVNGVAYFFFLKDRVAYLFNTTLF